MKILLLEEKWRKRGESRSALSLSKALRCASHDVCRCFVASNLSAHALDCLFNDSVLLDGCRGRLACSSGSYCIFGTGGSGVDEVGFRTGFLN